ncbi:hypothetical protein [Tsukamurella sputi]|nr:hypothetical protein [Tsukamurella sputi]
MTAAITITRLDRHRLNISQGHNRIIVDHAEAIEVADALVDLAEAAND